ncbi:MarR family winged helix-turn-helix transcriptional regulator [Nocardia sp. NPDC060256]|uniref:MarR family winged helix-turn-helix transcriptional regulator n=1 Tax=unclassified Nocardia TaxID=2637762 RepID=UPI00364D8726
MTAPSQDLDFGILLGLGYQQFVRELRETVSAQGFADTGRSDGYVLRSLARKPMNISELAERLEITKQGAAQIVDDMQRRGYLERRDDPNDRRAKLLYPTTRGNELLATAKKFHRRYEQRLIREHGAEAVAVLRTVLGAIATEDGMADPRFHAFGM